jgi:hypothetical protein
MEIGDRIDVRSLKDLARSKLPDQSALKQYILCLDDSISREEFLLVTKQSLRLLQLEHS